MLPAAEARQSCNRHGREPQVELAPAPFHPLVLYVWRTQGLEVRGSEWGETSARHPYTPGTLDEYQMKGVAKGTICKCMRRESRKHCHAEYHREGFHNIE